MNTKVLTVNSAEHLKVLDGWRGVSILFVLAAHLLPLGPKVWHLNLATGIFGMSVFFTLSGFLITSFLLDKAAIPDFLMRRFFRVLPLAWLYLAIALTFADAPIGSWLAHYFFYANLPPKQLVPLTDHMWSLCVEMQFYVGVAMLVAIFGVRGLLLLPILALLFTLFRISSGVYASSVTYFRIDEILAGCALALVYRGRLGIWVLQRLKNIPQWLLLLLFVLSCLAQGEWLNYFRPYLGAMLIGTTLLSQETVFVRVLGIRPLIYLASISYALYVIHPMLAASWLGSGDVFEKYAKRPLLFMVLLGLAHFSTYYYEHRWIAYGKRLSLKFRRTSS